VTKPPAVGYKVKLSSWQVDEDEQKIVNRSEIMKRLLIVPLFVVVLAQVGLAQDVCHRHVEPLGGFSYCLPDGWNLTKREGDKYKITYGTRGRFFTPNIYIGDEASAAPLAEYVAASLKAAQDSYEKVGATSIKILSQSNFKTTSGLAGIRVALRIEREDLVVRMLQYYFNGKGSQKLIITCAALEAEQESFNPVFERAMKTFQIDK
jgi:hypothetical protein